ncbi:diguanylate cyclase (GGDEF) domain-containing protein [Faunimonas pinastri]|uniref:Diguanylate cyclase (GGDEF) domain-containing protein n=1 Tax=Faunimonas pinastri TaxID=1855383 RepID=A0A1H9GHN3_9HYPH|nr:EAL domain-containing protein [Faunimonas pinastri]SEQ49605.1 diguanylate cyclase (GGDEF) domain-containing protein [Faunimonas pinastri]
MTRSRLTVLMILVIFTTFGLSYIWENGLEGIVDHALGIPYDGDFEVSERWNFILTSTAFSIISLVVPAALSFRAFSSLQRAHGELIEAQKRTEAIARHDSLTGLPNRRVFAECVGNAIVAARAKGTEVAVLIIDLDRFKGVNDAYGHGLGDMVLVEVAERLRSLVGQNTLFARLGGDEFAAVMEYPAGSNRSFRLAQRVGEEIRRPLQADGIERQMEATIGVALSSQGTMGSDDLIRAADLALTRGKREERGSIRFFEAGMDEEVRRRATAEADLRRALAEGQIHPAYQPLVALADGSLAGFEMLARWKHPTRGPVPPSEFIPLAEELNLIGKLTDGMVRQACLEAKNWPEHLTLAFNLSPAQLSDASLPQRLLSIMDESGFAPSRMEVEITENALMEGTEVAGLVLDALRAAGLRVVIDDFGTGYSSLGYLRDRRFDKVKIDRAFVQSMLESHESAKIVEAVIGLCSSLNLPTTGEGIETGAVLRELVRLGCTYGQGYYLGRPVSAADIARLLAGQTAFDMEGEGRPLS